MGALLTFSPAQLPRGRATWSRQATSCLREQGVSREAGVASLNSFIGEGVRTVDLGGTCSFCSHLNKWDPKNGDSLPIEPERAALSEGPRRAVGSGRHRGWTQSPAWPSQLPGEPMGLCGTRPPGVPPGTARA